MKIGPPSATPRWKAFGRERDRLHSGRFVGGHQRLVKITGLSWILSVLVRALLIYCRSVCVERFVLRGGSCRDDHFADSPGDQLRLVKMDPVSAVARH